MDFAQIKELIELVDKSSLSELTLTLAGDSLHLCKAGKRYSSVPDKTATVASDSPEYNAAENSDLPITVVPKPKTEVKEGVMVNAPIVGTFYASASPQKPAFVKTGDEVKAGDVLCIIEAMKVMNEITSKTDGVIAEILVKNEDMVEYNQPLFRILER